MIWLYGYGWPIYRGGPMFYADQVGLKHIADRLSYYAKETNDPSLEPAPLLKRLAAEGKTFASLAAAVEGGLMGAAASPRVIPGASRSARPGSHAHRESQIPGSLASRAPRNDDLMLSAA